MEFTIAELVDATKKVDSETKGIHRCNFSRSDDLRRLAAAARGQSETFPVVPDLEDMTALHFPKQQVQVRSGRRRAELAKYPHRKLAFLLVGLEELERHYRARREQLDKLWPDLKTLATTHDYPLVPFKASAESGKRCERYATRTPVKILVNLIIRREKAVALIRAHVDKYDQRHVELMMRRYDEQNTDEPA